MAAADQRQEDDDDVHHAAQPFIMLMSSTAMVPRLRKIDDEDGEADRRLRRRHGQHEHGEDLADEIAEVGREGDQIDVHGEQHQLDRHQDDDDVLAVQEDAEDPEGEQDRGDGQVMGEPDGHVRYPAPGSARLRISTVFGAAARPARRSTGGARLRAWRSVSTMAPIIATSRTSPAAWKR